MSPLKTQIPGWKKIKRGRARASISKFQLMRNSLSIFLGHKSTHLTMKNKLQFQKYFAEICFKRCGRYRRMHCFRKWIGNKPFLKAMLTQNYVASYGAFSSLAICLCFFFPFGENLPLLYHQRSWGIAWFLARCPCMSLCIWGYLRLPLKKKYRKTDENFIRNNKKGLFK